MIPRLQQWRDIDAQEAAAEAVGLGDGDAILSEDRTQRARDRAALGQDGGPLARD